MAVVTPENQTAIAELYVALFNRAPDADGFAFWTQALADGASLETITQSFIAVPEARAIYGSAQTSTEFVTAYYTSVMGREPDPSGLAFWTAALESAGGAGSDAARSFVIAQIVSTVNTPLPVKPDGLTDDAYALTYADRNSFANKSVISVFYATEYKGGNTALAKEVLKVVDPNVSSIDVAKALLAGNGGSGSTPTPVVTEPQIFKGTADADTFNGGSGDDTFSFVIDKLTPAHTTLTAGDTLNGGAGNDTLIITTRGSVNDGDFKGVNITAIETVVFNREDSGKLIYSATNGVKTVHVVGGDDKVHVTLGDGMNLKLENVFETSVGVDFTGAAEAVVTLTGAVDDIDLGIVTVSKVVTVISSGSANNVDDLELDTAVETLKLVATSDFVMSSLSGGSNTTVNVSGAGVVKLGALDQPSISRIDASANTGGLFATLDALNTGITLIGSKGDDTINVRGVVLTGTVDGGEGVNRLSVTSSDALATKTLGDKYTNFDILKVGNGVSVDLDNIAGISQIEINGGMDDTTLTNLSVTQAANIRILSSSDIGVISIGVKGATTPGQNDTVKATVTTNSGLTPISGNLMSLSLAGVENLELTGTGVGTAHTGLISLATGDARSLKSIIVKNDGGASISISELHTAKNLNIDVSGSSGTVEIDASAYQAGGVLTVTGGKGVNTITVAQQAEIHAGSGTDTIKLDTKGLALTDASLAGVEDKLVAIHDIDKGDTLRFDFGANNGGFSGQQVVVQAGLSGTDVYSLAGKALSNVTKAYAAFSFAGDTYVVADIDLNEDFGSGDVIVKLAGGVSATLEMRVDSHDVLSFVTAQYG